MSGYPRSINPFEHDMDDDDVDDDTFLKNSRRTTVPQSGGSLDAQLQSYQERRRAIEDSTLNSTQKSIGILRDSEQIGIATAEELMRQREKLERTDRQLDEINSTLRFSQKHINGIKSVFSSLKNYMSGKQDATPTSQGPSTSSRGAPPPESSGLAEKVNTYDRFDQHPSARLRDVDYRPAEQQQSTSASRDFSAKLDANLQEMCSNISRLKSMASEMSFELDSQNDLISNITDKVERADLTITKQNKEMNRILKK